jgi:DNA end-binding protein Ku
MAGPTFWKGYLKLSLVTCAVTLSPATTESEKVRFHTLNRATGNRVSSQYVDSVTGKPVRDSDEARGFPTGEDRYVVLEDEEIESVGLESTRTIDIENFVPAGSIAWVWYDRPHYLSPSDKVGQEAFAVIREAMARSKVVGISRLVMYRRERAVLLEAGDKGIVLWTLRYGDEVRDAKDYLPPKAEAKPERKLVGLLNKLIEERTRDWSPDLVRDPVQKQLKDIIAAKQGGKRRKAKAKPEPQSDNVISIMDALKKSLGPAAGKRAR